VQGIAGGAFEPASIHAVITLEVADDRFDGLTSPKGLALVLGQGFELAPVNDLDIGIVLIDPAVAEIDVDRFRGRRDAFEQDRGLFKLCVEGVSIVGIPGKVRAPTMSECEWVVASPVLTPNS
jgi:hypothetical protein